MTRFIVVIEGAAPNSMIPPGERRTVTLTPLIKKLIKGGFARIVWEEDTDGG